MRLTTIDEDEADLARVLASLDASLWKDITLCLYEVSPLCHINDAPFLVELIGDLDDQGNVLERTEELEPLPADLNPITHIDDLEEWTEVIVFFFW